MAYLEKIPPGDNDRKSGESERRSPNDPLLMLLSPALWKTLYIKEDLQIKEVSGIKK